MFILNVVIGGSVCFDVNNSDGIGKSYVKLQLMSVIKMTLFR